MLKYYRWIFFITVESAKEANKKFGVDYINRGFDYDFLFVFSSDIKDWISSQKQSKYAATKKSSQMKKHEEVFSENENLSIFGKTG